VAVAGNSILIGCKDASASGDPDLGAAYLYDGTTGALVYSYVEPTHRRSPAGFGRAVTVSDTTVWAGTPTDAAGLVFAFDGTLSSGNHVPVVANDVFDTTEDTPLTAAAPGVLANDTDADGNPLTAALVAGPSHATLTLNAKGSFTYTPAANFNGADSFTYKANDGTADSNVATVTIIVAPVNDPPVAQGGILTTAEDSPGTDTLVAADIDSPTLTYSVVTQPQHGTVTITNVITGAYTYTPAPDFNGGDSFTFQASDGSAVSNVATIAVTVAPIIDPTTTTVILSPNPSTYGQTVTFTAVVRPISPTAGTPTGRLQFRVDGSDFGAPTPLTADTASLDTPILTAGSHDVTAVYLSDSTDFQDSQTTAAEIQSVRKALLTATAADRTRVYGSANPAFDVGYAGFVLGEGPGVLGGALTFTTLAMPFSHVGSYPITPGGVTAANYAITFMDGTLAVTPAFLIVIADDRSRTYGDPNPPLTYTLTGFVNGETAATAGVTGGPSLSTTAVPASPVGSYEITAAVGSLSAGNYDFIPVDGKLTVTPAVLSVTPVDATRIYGNVNPPLTGTISGLKNGDPIATSYATTAMPASDVGSYAITAAVADPESKLGNYTVTLNTGTLAVMPAPLTVGSVDVVRPYGAPNPGFSANYSGFVLGQNEGVLGGSLTFSTSATSGSPVGIYPIIGGGPTSANYAITFVNGTLTIQKAPTMTALVSSAPSTAFGQMVTFTATVVAFAPGGGAPTGIVTFFDGTTALGTANLNGGQASLATAGLSAGGHVITAVFSGDGNFLASTAATVTQMINVANLPGKVTGGGSTDSGVRNFGFVVQTRVQDGVTSYTGSLEFHDKTNGINLHSTAITLVSINADGVHAMFQGTATVNGRDGYRFTVFVEDNGEPGGGRDRFRIQISGPDGFGYDSLDYATLGGRLDRAGNIQIHKEPGV
jgi:VCBS repeat-containing protein